MLAGYYDLGQIGAMLTKKLLYPKDQIINKKDMAE